MFKNHKLIIFVLCTFLIVLFSGCTPKDEPTITEESNPQKSIESNESKVEIVDSKETKEGVQSPISGIYTDKDITKRPFAVMFDNQKKARPQAGLDQAEMVYEILAEGWITRYMGVFLINEPELIGPVRSARPYFIDKAMEFDALYIHDGGSPQALQDIKDLNIADISAQSRGKDIFWRKNHKSRPHNEYTSAEAIRKAAKQSNYKESGEYETLVFNTDDQNINGSSLNKIQIPYAKDYKPSFQFKKEENLYYRYINNDPHLDEVSKVHLTAKNIIIQKAETKVIDSEGRRTIKLVGKGEGFFITNGEMIKITWEKKSRREITRFYYEGGQEIKLNPGVTWIEIIPSNLDLITE